MLLQLFPALRSISLTPDKEKPLALSFLSFSITVHSLIAWRGTGHMFEKDAMFLFRITLQRHIAHYGYGDIMIAKTYFPVLEIGSRTLEHHHPLPKTPHIFYYSVKFATQTRMVQLYGR